MADDHPGLETPDPPLPGAYRPVVSRHVVTMSAHMQTVFRDFARTGRVGKEALDEFTRQGWVHADEYGSLHLTAYGASTLKSIEKGSP